MRSIDCDCRLRRRHDDTARVFYDAMHAICQDGTRGAKRSLRDASAPRDVMRYCALRDTATRRYCYYDVATRFFFSPLIRLITA